MTDTADVGSLTAEVVDTSHGAAPGPAAIPLFSPGDCTVTSTLDTGPGSLSACMAQLGAGDVITFDTAIFLPGNPQTITLNSPLPTIVTDNVAIDGSNAGVILDGSGTPGGTSGLVIDGVSNVVIKGLQILNFPNNGIELRNGASDNTIGGTNGSPGGPCSGDCNLISGNGLNGVFIYGSGTMSNTVAGNYVGTDINGAVALGNTWAGVTIFSGAQWNIIGGDTPGERNLISGNGDDGITIDNPGTMSNTVAGNYVGTDATGSYAIPNQAEGISLWDSSSHTSIRNNLASGNGSSGIGLTNGSSYNTVIGNYIGTNVSGTAAISNTKNGVLIAEGAQYNVIGGDTAGERNLISGNGNHGVGIYDSGTMSNTVSGNYIGTDAAGTAALGNHAGVEICESTDNTIGGTTAGERNVIAGSDKSGVHLCDDAARNQVLGNYIGTDATGTAGLGNAEGVGIDTGAQQNTIGPDNLIAYNVFDGVRVDGSTCLRNTITHNSIYSHTGKGIELIDGGNLELFPPILTDVTTDTVTGIAVPNSTVEVFSDNEDEGQVFEGDTTADGSSNFSFNQPGGFTLPNVTATATDGDGNTSEFSDEYPWLVDVAAEVIFQPGKSGLKDQPVTPSVKVSNPGTSVAANVNVTVEASGPALPTDYSDSTIIAMLNPLACRTLTFAPFTPTALGSYVFTSTVSLVGDQDPSNDVLAKTVNVGEVHFDVWTKDNPYDNGDVPTFGWWESPDIWVRNQDDGWTNPTHQNPISGTVNYVYVRVRNRGTLTATDTVVKVYWHEPALGMVCGDWPYIGQQTVSSLAPGATQIISVTWVPTRTGHTCLFDVLESAQDPVTQQCDVSWDNNIEQRNVDIIAQPPEGASALAATNINFDVANVNSRAALVDVVLDRSTVPADGSVTLDLGSALFAHWQSVNGGTPLDGAVVMGGSVISITSSSTATIRSLPLLAYESRPLTLTVDTPSAVASTVSVYEVIDGSVMGGNTFHFVTEGGPIYLPIIFKSY